MKSKVKKYLILFVTVFPFVPFIVFANGNPENFREFLGVFMNLFSLIIPVLVSLAVLLFLSGGTIYIWKGASETERLKGKQFMFWGLIGIFVMVSFLGLVNILEETFFPSQQLIGLPADWLQERLNIIETTS